MGIVLSKKLYQLMPGMIGFHCPACKTMHFFNTKEFQHSGPQWDFNGDVNCPTVNPSMRMSTNVPRPGHDPNDRTVYTQCHLFIRNGMIEYCTDCPHELSGQTIPIPDHNRQSYED